MTRGGGIRGRGSGRRGRLLASGLALVVAGTLMTACSAVRNSLGTTNGACFVDLPAATAAVGGHTDLIGVRLVPVSNLKILSPKLYRAAIDAPGPRVERVCLMAFGGHFIASRVRRPIGHATGRLAVVEIEYPDKRLLATLLLVRPRPPMPFGHNNIGLL